MAGTYLDQNTITKMEPLNSIKILFNKVENELTGGELSEIGLVLIRALKRVEEKRDEKEDDN
ncbi:Uncharacterised protein [uncultured Clostridium sp.]|uniref:hypothetical protein n=1 Tax=uncultured Clostridium sp. TaxID=59620 RepID=UPI0008222F56|nr:hypothetical protein [uncultured Clostridium sp.]SCJ95933.1 Uncharacterised protein [uncultured Clostridium sp.]